MSSKTGSAAATTTSTGSFDTLLGELDTMMKSMPAQAETMAKGGDADGKCSHGEDKASCSKCKEGGGAPMVKSFSITLESGETVEVEDAGLMLKALQDQFSASEAKTLATLTAAVAIIGSQGTMLKSFSAQLGDALTKIEAQDKQLGEQATLIKSMQESLTKFGSQGAGRKAVLSVVQPQTGTATAAAAKTGMPEGVSHEQFFAKAMALQGEGKLTANDISLAETCLNSGIAIPETLVSRVLA